MLSILMNILDTFVLSLVHSNGSRTPVPLTAQGIAWDTDVNVKFGTPPSNSWANSIKPPNWPLSIVEVNGGSYQRDEELIVWMRTAALPNFRKLHRRLNRSDEHFKMGLPAGSYQLDITYGSFFYLSVLGSSISCILCEP